MTSARLSKNRQSNIQRFWDRVDKNGPIPENNPQLGPCWQWKGTIDQGYGKMWSVEQKHLAAHRWYYEYVNGPIPEGKEPDHLCRNRACVNLAHIEIVTKRENIVRGVGPTAINAAKKICINGHLLERSNLVEYQLKQGVRECETCRQEKELKRKSKSFGEAWSQRNEKLKKIQALRTPEQNRERGIKIWEARRANGKSR